MAERRRAGGRLLQRGTLSQAAIARRLGVSEAAVSKWAQQVQRAGLRGLRARQALGRPAALSPVPHLAIRTVLRRGAVAFGFETERWPWGRMRTVIGRPPGRWYSVVHIQRWWPRWGWSRQQPAGQARARDEAQSAAWRHHDGPRSKKKPAV
jgi:putative transposase